MGLTPPPRLAIPLTPPPLYLIKDLVFKDQRVQLDGYHFKNCAFVNCTLTVRQGNFRIEECFFQGEWWTYVEGNAQRVVRLASILDWGSVAPGLKAFVHENGGVSIL